jgi:hypothetical protein
MLRIGRRGDTSPRSAVSFLAISDGVNPERALAFAAFFREAHAEIADPQTPFAGLALET